MVVKLITVKQALEFGYIFSKEDELQFKSRL